MKKQATKRTLFHLTIWSSINWASFEFELNWCGKRKKSVVSWVIYFNHILIMRMNWINAIKFSLLYCLCVMEFPHQKTFCQPFPAFPSSSISAIRFELHLHIDYWWYRHFLWWKGKRIGMGNEMRSNAKLNWIEFEKKHTKYLSNKTTIKSKRERRERGRMKSETLRIFYFLFLSHILYR